MTEPAITRRGLIGGSAALVLGAGRREMADPSAFSVAKPEPTKPNFIVIYCDDLGYGDLGCYGSHGARTPHLDALAAQGTRFTNWYSCSPVCSPSRASLLTGRYPQRNGVTQILGGGRDTAGLGPTETTIASALKPLGYRTALFGKWHLGLTEQSRPNAHGFDDYYGFLAGCVDYYSHIYYWGGRNPIHDLWHNHDEVWDNGRYLTEVITEKGVRFIEGNKSGPYFLYLAYNAPHYPMHAPRKYLDRFPDLPPDRRIMAAMVSAVDDGVGQVVSALRRSGQWENSVIFFSSDNGPSSESRNWLDGREDPYYGGTAGALRGHKGSLFDGGMREPAILCWPGRVPAGRTCGEVGAMMDIFPTLLNAAGGELPADRVIDGHDILPMASGRVHSPHERLFWAYNGQLAVRQGAWKLVLDGKLDFSRTQPDAVHLSDLASDPGERINLAPRYPDLAADLAAAAHAWQDSFARRP